MTDRIDEHLWVAGLRLLPSVWVVPHWDALREDVREYFLTHIPAVGIAIGIDESTMLVRIADSWSIHGKGSVFVRADGRAMRSSSLPTNAPPSAPAIVAAVLPLPLPIRP